MSSIIELLRVLSSAIVVVFGWVPVESIVGGDAAIFGVVAETADDIGVGLGFDVIDLVESDGERELGRGDEEAGDGETGDGRARGRAGREGDALGDELDEELLDQGAVPDALDEEVLDAVSLGDELDEELLDAGSAVIEADAAGDAADQADRVARPGRADATVDISSSDTSVDTSADSDAGVDDASAGGGGGGGTGNGGGGGGGGRTTDGGGAVDGGGATANGSATDTGGATDSSGSGNGGGGSVLAGSAPADLGELAGCHVVAAAGRARVEIGCRDGSGVFAGFSPAGGTDGAAGSAGGTGSGTASDGGSGSGGGTGRDRAAGGSDEPAGETVTEVVDVDIDASGGRERSVDGGRDGGGGRTSTGADGGVAETGDLPSSVSSQQAAPDRGEPNGGAPRNGSAADDGAGRRTAGSDLGAPAENAPFDAPPLDGIGLEELTVSPELRDGVRYDEPALEFLPEIEAAAERTGIPPALLAAVVRITSGGDPAAVFPDGGIGLAKVPAPELVARGIEPAAWFDPATNLGVASEMLAAYLGVSGSPELALAAYLAETGYCNPAGTCVPSYGEGWYDYYLAALAQPARAGLERAPGFGLDEFSPSPVASLAELGTPPPVEGLFGDNNGRPERPRRGDDGDDRATAVAAFEVPVEGEGDVTVTRTGDGLAAAADRPRVDGTETPPEAEDAGERELPPVAERIMDNLTGGMDSADGGEGGRGDRDRSAAATDAEAGAESDQRRRDRAERDGGRDGPAG